MNKKKKIICSILSMIFLIFMIHLYEIKINSIIASIDNINQNLIQIITCILHGNFIRRICILVSDIVRIDIILLTISQFILVN